MIVQNSKGQSRLIAEVLNKGLCVQCGACTGFCPYFEYMDGKVVALDSCISETSRCFQICPRVIYEKDSHKRENGIGQYKKIITARSTDMAIRSKSQYGGVVSGLMIYALEKGIIKSAVLTNADNNSSPAGFLAKSRTDVLRCAGSKYSGGGGLQALNRALVSDGDMLGLVGLPCQIEAVNRMKLVEPDGDALFQRISLKIGLFCTWALDFRALDAFLAKNKSPGKVIKYDIPPPPAEKFTVQTLKGSMEYPLSEIRPFIQKGCLLCDDMTGETADLSVGTLEGEPLWNTVVVRTQKGEALFDEAVKEGLLETGELPEKNLKHLLEASTNKRTRSIENLKAHKF